MRLLIVTALTGLALTGCTAGTPGASPSASSSSSAAPAASASGGVDPCVVGDWVTTDSAVAASSAAASATLTGGKGVKLTVGKTGQTLVDFTAMEPMRFTAKLAGLQAKGEFWYRGRVSGTISASAGSWKPTGQVDWSGVTLTVDMTEPVKGRPVDNVKVSTYANDQTGGAVDNQPMLGEATYTCSPSTLTLGSTTGRGPTWTLVHP